MKKMMRTAASVTLSAMALIAPVQAFANNYVAGSSSNSDAILTDDVLWTTIRTVNVTITDAGSHGCVATASADVSTPGPAGVENQYLFVLTRNTTTPAVNTGSERQLELVDNSGVNDPNSKPVSTTLHFTGLTSTNGTAGTGLHTFRLLGKKVQAADTNATVQDASLAVICVPTP
jgi:hypothetical protein